MAVDKILEIDLSKLTQDGANKLVSQFKGVIGSVTNPKKLATSIFTKNIPGFAAAVAASAIIVTILKKFDELEKKFTDQINTKRRADRDNEEIARIQAGLAQDIFTPSPGIYDPRDVYNSLDEFNTNQRKLEADYTLRNTSGVE